MASLRYDHIALHKESPLDRKRIAGIVDKTLGDTESILVKFAWYAKKGDHNSLNAANLLIPPDLPSPVVLDATAKQNFLWELLEDKADIKPIPSNTRSYRNVTLHVARAKGVGKNAMIEHGPERIPRLIAQLQKDLAPTRKVFVCLHQRIEHLALKYETGFSSWDVGHWMAIDGRNDWKDYDTAVIFGLPFRDTIWANNAFMAIKGVQTNDWLKSPAWKTYSDVRDEMQVKQITVSVIQAINRIQCRKVIDEHGNCPPSDVFIVLPKGERGDRILEAIQQEMPGIATLVWDFELDGEKVQVRKGSSHEALLVFMKNRLPGETAMSLIKKELGLSTKALDKMRETLRNQDHLLTKQLAELRVTYMVSGVGRGARSYLLKH